MASGGRRLRGVTEQTISTFMRKKGALLSFEFSIEPITQEAKLKPEKFKREMLKVQDKVGQDLATSAVKTMSRWLSPENPRRIGYTGKASQNLLARRVFGSRTKGGKVEAVWYVFEGSKTPANKYIRRGVKKNLSKSNKALRNARKNKGRYGSRPKVNIPGLTVQEEESSFASATFTSGTFLHTLSEWAKRRGLAPQYGLVLEGKNFLKWKGSSEKRLMTKVNLAQERQKRWNKMVWAVWHSMMRKGRSEAYRARWGEPFYDYVRRYVEGDSRGNTGSGRTAARSRLTNAREITQNIRVIFGDYIKSVLTAKGTFSTERKTRTLATRGYFRNEWD
jgi:hypothetical protein